MGNYLPTAQPSEFLGAVVRDCVLCGKPGQGLHPTTAGRACPDCYLRLFHCEGCHTRLAEGGGVTYPDGLSVCNKCLRKPRCSCCGRLPVSSGESVCGKCRATHFPCRMCSQPRARRGDAYCHSCRESHPFCPTCDRLTSEIWEYPERAPTCLDCGHEVRNCCRCGTLHTRHWEEYNGRFFCRSCLGLEVEERSTRLRYCRWCARTKELDTQETCRDCARDRVESVAQTWELLGSTLRFLRRELGLVIQRPFGLDSVGPETLAALAPRVYREGSQALGLCAQKSQFVLVREGMPAWLTMAVLAHEYAHSWQYEHCPPQSKDLVEGFACWVGLKLLDALERDDYVEVMISLPCPTYGEGLRRCLALEERLGEAGTIAFVQEISEFPYWAKKMAEES